MATKKNNPVAKPTTSQRLSPDTQTARGQAALSRLGGYLSAKGTGGSADTKAARSSERTRQFMIDIAKARGGGQGKAAPKQEKKNESLVRRAMNAKVTMKMTEQQKKDSFYKEEGSYKKPAGSYKKPAGSYKKPAGSYKKPAGSYKKADRYGKK